MFRTNYNRAYNAAESCEPISDLPSMAVPDEAKTIRQLLYDYALKGHFDVQDYEEHYDGEDPDPDDFDETRLLDFDMTEASHTLSTLQSLIDSGVKSEQNEESLLEEQEERSNAVDKDESSPE